MSYTQTTNPLTPAHCCHMVTAIKQQVADRVKQPSFVFFDMLYICTCMATVGVKGLYVLISQSVVNVRWQLVLFVGVHCPSALQLTACDVFPLIMWPGSHMMSTKAPSSVSDELTIVLLSINDGQFTAVKPSTTNSQTPTTRFRSRHVECYSLKIAGQYCACTRLTQLLHDNATGFYPDTVVEWAHVSTRKEINTRVDTFSKNK